MNVAIVFYAFSTAYQSSNRRLRSSAYYSAHFYGSIKDIQCV